MKKIILTLFVLVAGLQLHASLLYWQISSSSFPSGLESYAVVKSGSGDTWSALNIVDPNGTILPSAYVQNAGSYYASVNDATAEAMSYIVEVYTYSGSINNSKLYAASDKYTYSDVSSYLKASAMTDPTYAAWSPAVTQVVPEPTSGLLFLIGIAGLALRRKVIS